MIMKKYVRGLVPVLMAGVFALGGLSQTAMAVDANACGTINTTTSICLQNITRGHTYRAYALGSVTAGAVSDSGLATDIAFVSADDRNVLDYARSAKDIMRETVKNIDGDAGADPLNTAMGWVKSDGASDGSTASVINTDKQDEKLTAFLDGIDYAIRQSMGQENTPTVGNRYSGGNALLPNLKPATVYIITDTDDDGKAGAPRLAGTSEVSLKGSIVSETSMEGYSIPNTVTVKAGLDDISIAFTAVDDKDKPVEGRTFTLSGGKLSQPMKEVSKANGGVIFDDIPFASSYTVTLQKLDGSDSQEIVISPKSTTTVNGAMNDTYYDVLDHTDCSGVSCFKDDDKTDGRGLFSPDSTATWRIPDEPKSEAKDTGESKPAATGESKSATLPKLIHDNMLLLLAIAAILLVVLVLGIVIIICLAIRSAKAHEPRG
ncbi:hypothetical protein BG22_07825 [Bifidobacterium sp. UTBIF-78]|nr:hypothetical protein BG22_07825 [Bifidobacterium sp. UTBIF-78]